MTVNGETLYYQSLFRFGKGTTIRERKKRKEKEDVMRKELCVFDVHEGVLGVHDDVRDVLHDCEKIRLMMLLLRGSLMF